VRRLLRGVPSAEHGPGARGSAAGLKRAGEGLPYASRRADGVQTRFGTSTAYHVVLPISQKTSDLALNCDMSGIAMCIITIFLVGLRYAFWCHEDLGHAYMCVVGIWSLLLFALPQVQWFTRLHKYAVPFLYFGFVVFALVPLIHWAVLVGGIFRYSFRLFLVP